MRSRLLGCTLLAMVVGAGCGDSEGSKRRAGGDGPDGDTQARPDDGTTDDDSGDDTGSKPGGGGTTPGGGGGGTPNGDAGVQPDGSTDPDDQLNILGSVTGVVSFAKGRPAAGVEVVLAKQTYVTDERGVFQAKDVAPGKHQVRAQSSKTSAAQVEIAVQKDKEARLSLTVLPLEEKAVSASTKFDVEDTKAGFKVAVPEKGLTKKGGGEVTGEVKASYSVVKTPAETKALPGGLKTKVNTKEVELQVFGMVDLRFYQGDEELVVASEIELQVPLFANNFSDGQETDAYTFDPELGLWKTEGKATIHKPDSGPGHAVIKPKHLSWWGVALPIEEVTCIAGRVESETGEEEPYLSVQATGLDHHAAYTTMTDEHGNFCLPVKPGSNVRVVAGALGEAGSEYRWQGTATAPLEAAMCGDDSSGCGLVQWDLPDMVALDCEGRVGPGSDRVYVLSSSNALLDQAVLDNFAAHGQDAELGVEYHQLTGSDDLSSYDAVYLQMNANWSVGELSADAQRALVEFVRCGGGIVTTEWTGYETRLYGYETIQPIWPFTYTTYTTIASETFSVYERDSTVHAGLPDSFTVALTSFAGTQSSFGAKPGALEFLRNASMNEPGLLGWDYEQGRVASFSTTVGQNELADENFSRLIVNTVNWAQGE